MLPFRPLVAAFLCLTAGTAACSPPTPPPLKQPRVIAEPSSVAGQPRSMTDPPVPRPALIVADEPLLPVCDPKQGCCPADQMNAGLPLKSTCFAAALAREYVPTHSYELVRMELHQTGSELAILDDEQGLPGRVLAKGRAIRTGDGAWQGIELDPPIKIVMGRRYWIATSTGGCSVAADGTKPRSLASFKGVDGPWVDHTQGVFAFVWRLYERCEKPAQVAGEGPQGATP